MIDAALQHYVSCETLIRTGLLSAGSISARIRIRVVGVPEDPGWRWKYFQPSVVDVPCLGFNELASCSLTGAVRCPGSLTRLTLGWIMAVPRKSLTAHVDKSRNFRT